MIIGKYTNAYTLNSCMNTRFCYSIITSNSNPLNKNISLSGDELKVHSEYRCHEGSVVTCDCQGLFGLFHRIESIGVYTAIAPGRIGQHGNWFDGAEIEWLEHGDNPLPHANDTSVYHHSSIPNFFMFKPDKPAVMLFDVEGEFDSPESALDCLRQVDPCLQFVGFLIVQSTTGFIKKESTGEQLVGANGYHIYCLVKNGADIPRYGKSFAKRAWLKGHGRIEISETGEYLQRQIVNSRAFNPDFSIVEAPANLDDGLIQDRPNMKLIGTDLLDTEKLPDLDREEESYFLRLVREAKVVKVRENATSSGHTIRSTGAIAPQRQEAIKLVEIYT